MRITICCKHFGAWGGAEAFLLNFVRCLREEGHSVKVIAATADARVEGVQVVRLQLPPLPATFRDLALARASGKALAADDADVTFSDQKCWGAQVVRVGGGVHREYLKQLAESYRSPLGRWLFSAYHAVSPKDRLRLRIESGLYRQPGLRCIVANSDMVRQEIARHFPHVADRVRVVYNGVDTARFHPSLKERHRARVREELRVPHGALLGVFVGHGWRRKGLSTFVEALGRLARKAERPAAYGLVVGRGDRRGTERFARRCGAAECIRFAGPAEPDRYYGAADLLVLPSFYDPCANATLEGLACGLPALTTAHNGAHELLTPGKDGFWLDDASDSAQLAAFIEHFLDRDRLAAASEAARALALQHTLACQYRELRDVLAAASDGTVQGQAG
jgi:UDP-glucose:(heptosyl)LPS alpha-1,3-glucosyltransferase